MRHRVSVLLLSSTAIVLITSLISGHLNKQDTHMNEPIMMHVSSDEDLRFDATRWFTSGMYKRRQIELAGQLVDHEWSMLRSAPPPLTPAQHEELSFWAFSVLQRDMPEVDARPLMENPPALHHRLFYRGSGFEAPDKPVDNYELHLSLPSGRYTISVERDGVTGAVTYASKVTRVDASDTEAIQLFERLEVEDKARRTPKP